MQPPLGMLNLPLAQQCLSFSQLTRTSFRPAPCSPLCVLCGPTVTQQVKKLYHLLMQAVWSEWLQMAQAWAVLASSRALRHSATITSLFMVFPSPRSFALLGGPTAARAAVALGHAPAVNLGVVVFVNLDHVLVDAGVAALGNVELLLGAAAVQVFVVVPNHDDMVETGAVRPVVMAVGRDDEFARPPHLVPAVLHAHLMIHVVVNGIGLGRAGGHQQGAQAQPNDHQSFHDFPSLKVDEPPDLQQSSGGRELKQGSHIYIASRRMALSLDFA
eukprot:TRINITY_DN6263_c0_g1_i1.p1 TRINITY_DN6263_c0_g1~~TRINITY_DN6263_c0_g1_i1.p1  ORF type:complete len:273 (+),score=31.85 TRINITY_DN6263_c0_g1_i1:473-1291(+)